MSGMTGTGLKKWTPTNRGRRSGATAAASRSIEIELVFVPKMAPGGAIRSSSAHRRVLTSTSSKTASTTRSARSARGQLGPSPRPGRASAPAPRPSSRPFATARSRLPAIRSRPASARASSGSYRSTAHADRRVDLGDPVAHQARACHEDALDRHDPPPRSDASRAAGRPRRRVEGVVGDLGDASPPSPAAVRRRPSSDARTRSATIAQTWVSARASRAGASDRAAAPRWRSTNASSSGTPSPVEAVVMSTSGRLGRGRSSPRLSPGRGRGQHRPELARGPLRARPIALVHDDDVGDLEQARLDRLDLVAHLGRLEDDGRVGRRGHLDLALAGPDGLDEDEVEAGGVDHGRGRARRRGEAAGVAAGRHRADEHVAVRGVRLHPDPIAEERAAGDRAGRVDGQTATARPAARTSAMSAETSVDLPAPGGPVMPTRWARPASG